MICWMTLASILPVWGVGAADRLLTLILLGTRTRISKLQKEMRVEIIQVEFLAQIIPGRPWLSFKMRLLLLSLEVIRDVLYSSLQ
jgi:hypothetical protein